MSKKNSSDFNARYKYLLHFHLNQLPHSKYKITSKQLPKKIGVSTETFRKWKYIKKDSNATIPADKLALIANFFDIRIEEFFNYPVPKLTYAELENAEINENPVKDEKNS